MTIIVKEGTLKIGDYVICGLSSGRVRAMMDYRGNMVKSAGPSMPVSVLGLNIVPEAGDMAYVVDEKMAKNMREKTARIAENKDRRPRAVAKHVRISPYKVRIVLDIIRGKGYREAVAILEMRLQRLTSMEVVKLKEELVALFDDIKVENDKEKQRVYPVSREISDVPSVILKKHSWNMLTFKKR